METNSTQQQNRTKVLRGVVVSDRMEGTVVVAVTRFVQHPKYRKFVKSVKKYHADDPSRSCKLGDAVAIAPCRPVSKTKQFRVVVAAEDRK